MFVPFFTGADLYMQKTFCSRNQRLVVVLFENCILNKTCIPAVTGGS